jgi:uncharacterized membrane protein YvbJ
MLIVFGLLLAIIIVLGVSIIFLNMREEHDISSGLIRDCFETNDEDAIMECLNEKAFSIYADENNCEKALKVYDDIPDDSMSDRSIAMLYDEAYSLSLSCDDLSLRTYWNEKSERKWERLEGMN